MRRIEGQHIERRVTCVNCPNTYCVDCNFSAGCDNCGSTEFYTSHGKGAIYSKNDILSLNDIDDVGESINVRLAPSLDAPVGRILRGTGGQTLTSPNGIGVADSLIQNPLTPENNWYITDTGASPAYSSFRQYTPIETETLAGPAPTLPGEINSELRSLQDDLARAREHRPPQIDPGRYRANADIENSLLYPPTYEELRERERRASTERLDDNVFR